MYELKESKENYKKEIALEEGFRDSINDRIDADLTKAGITQQTDQLRKIIKKEIKTAIKKKKLKERICKPTCFLLGVPLGASLMGIVFAAIYATGL